MFDLELKDDGKCVLHGKPLTKDHRNLCMKVADLARLFADEYRLGLGDRYNFEVEIVVRGSKVVFIGHPTQVPKNVKKKVPVC